VKEPSAAEVVLITTPDERIADACEELAGQRAFRSGQVVGHASGATGLDALAAARSAGADVLSMHPLQTFPDAVSAIEGLPGSAMAITAEDERAAEVGERLARDVGARPFRIPAELKPLYHAAAVFASNYVVAVLAEAERLFAAAGVTDRSLWMPLSRATVENVDRLGPEAALTGPAVRGDAGTVRANIEAIGAAVPDAVHLYATLARAALDLAGRSGRLDPEQRREVEEAFSTWT
jgi:predicted short-subunit dehydrogenase-like oxidoreductase (DUF2520 family)